MKRYVNLFLINLLIISYLQTNAQTTFSPEEVREDMAVLKAKLEKYHPAPYGYISDQKYNHLYDSLFNSVTRPLTYLEAFHKIAPLIIAVQDGHTAVGHNKKLLGKNPKLVPIYVRKIQNRFFISYNCSKDSTLLRGTEVFSINDKPISEVFEQLKTLVSADNYNDLARAFYVQSDFPTYYLKYFGVKDSIKIGYRLANNSDISIKKIACLDGKQVGTALNKRYKWAIRKNLNFKIVDSLTKTASIDITSFLMAGKLDFGNIKFKRTLKADFQKIKEKGIENLIIDLRSNGGGYIPNVSRLLAYLMPEPFTLIDSLEFKRKAYFKIAPVQYVLPPLMLWAFFKKKDEIRYRTNSTFDNNSLEKDLHFNGNLYFLINSGCYSATTFTLSLAKDRGIGTYIGEQVGGATWGSNAVNWYEYKLPNTKIVVHSPLFRLNHKLKNPVNSFFLQPDFLVGRNYEELQKNNDNVMDFTLGIIRNSQGLKKAK